MSFSVLTESELYELLSPPSSPSSTSGHHHSSNHTASDHSTDYSPSSPRMIDGIDQLRSISTLDLVCVCIYIFFTIFGLLANFWVLHLVINVLRCRESRQTISVPVYIFALTLLNILVLCGLPFTVSDLLTGQWWPKSAFVCTSYWLVELMNKTMASFILSLLSVSCYFAVCRPKITYLYNNLGVSICLILVGFALTFAEATPIYLHSGLFYLIKSSNDQSIVINYGVKCVFQPEDEREQYQFTLLCFVCGYGAPALLMLLCYGAILRRVAKKVQRNPNYAAAPRASVASASLLNNGNASGSHTTTTYRTNSRFWRVAKSSSILVVFYLLSWTPYWTAMLTIMHQSVGADDRSQNLLASVAIVLHVLPYVNCAGSPLLYTLLNRQMRKMYEDSRRRRKSSSMGGQNSILSSVLQSRSNSRNDSMALVGRRLSMFESCGGQQEGAATLGKKRKGRARSNTDGGKTNRLSLINSVWDASENGKDKGAGDGKRRKTVCIV